VSTVRKRFRSLLVLALVAAFLVSSFSVLISINTVNAATLQLKWVANLGLGTYIAPLAAHLIPRSTDMQIVVTGVSRVDQGYTNGSIAVLNGTTGAVIWEKQIGNIQDHMAFEIADLNNDGNQEIILDNWNSTVALYGNNGSIYWQSPAPSFDNYPVVADVNGDGYPEVFVCSGQGPYFGVDYITELSHNGTILAQTTDWHPCWGGLALGDPYFNGTFILLQGDRSITYNPSSDPYQNGGWGVRVLDAQTLQPMWNDDSVLSSSATPMLADVDGNGVLEVVAQAQSRGLAVYNALTGSVDTTGGIYRYSQKLPGIEGLQNMSEHSQPTIYTAANGDPQIIVNHASDNDPLAGNPMIWDLRTWTLTGVLNVTSGEPPKMGRVTADGNMDIIAVDESGTVHIFNQNFQEVGNYSGLANPNCFPLVADVDSDGYNELVLSSRSGSVYCFSTPAPASNPPPRSNVQFSSEYHLGVAEYVEPPGPRAPQIGSPSPANGASNVSTGLSTLSFNLFDYQGHPMNFSVTTAPNVGGGTGTNVSNGKYTVPISGLSSSTTYSWTVNATVNTTNGTYTNATTYTFTTTGGLPPSTLLITAPSPANGQTNVSTSLKTLSFNLNDSLGNPMNYTVTTIPNIVVSGGTGTNVLNGKYTVSIGGLSNSTTYQWAVNATDGSLSTLANYTFMTQLNQTNSAGWKYRKSVTIDHTKVAANLTNFPVLVDITDLDLAANAQTNGNDIFFTDSNGNKLNHEIESYNSSSGHLTAWVMIPNLSSTSNTTLYMYYGNPSASNQQNPSGVWNSNFLMVQHLSGTSGTQYDSTSNHNNGSPVGAVTEGTSGKIGGCDQFTGGYVSLPQVLTSQAQFTFGAWIFPQSGARYIVSEWANNQGAFLQVASDNHLQFYVNGAMVGESITLNQWHYVVGTYNGATAMLYLDGGSPVSVSAGTPTWPTSQVMYIGDRYDHIRQFLGLVDEVRVSNIARSTSWISTEYADQNNPSTFYTLGTQEIPVSSPPTVSNPAPSDGQSGVALNPTLSVSISDLNPMNITFSSNSTGLWLPLGTYSNVSSGVCTQITTNMNGYGTTYWWSVQVTDGTYWTNQTFSFTTKTSPSSWWNSSWQYRMNVTIDHTKVSSDQSNFPLLIDLTNSTVATEAQPQGQDFVFVDANNQKLDDQIESYNSGAGHLVAWVRIPLLSSTSDTTITMYYGNPTCPDQQNPTGVWDSNYLMVLHLSENQTRCYDSTTNGNNGTLNGSVSQVPGKIDGSLNFTGGYVSLPQVLTSQTQFTFSAWIFPQSGARYFISEWANNQGAFLQVASDNHLQLYVNGVMVGESITLNQWHYVVATYDGTTARLYLDGGSPASVSAAIPIWGSQSMYLGDRYDHTRQFNGLIDEVRVSNFARSSSWISTEYADQNSPSTFYTIGTQETYS
jgi:hypothetical protein